MIYLIGKKIDDENLEVLKRYEFQPSSLEEDFEIRSGSWSVEDGWLIGQNPMNAAAMVIAKQDFFDDIMLDFKAMTVLPSTHDINAMWNGSWDYEKNERNGGYVVGIAGWWRNKVGIEKAPSYDLNAATSIFPFVPGQVYHIQAGSVAGHIFVVVDGQLILEVTDPNPINSKEFGKVGFEAYCSHIKITDFSVKKAIYTPFEETYQLEF